MLSVINLLLNSKQTKCMIFRTPNTFYVKVDLLLNGESVNPVDSTIFLDITIDSKLHRGPLILMNRRVDLAQQLST